MRQPMTSSTFARATALPLLITLFVPAAAAARQAGSVATDDIFAALNIREGSTVCEMGAGDGELTLAVAKRVGPNGRVYSSELGEDRIKALRGKIGGERSHVVVIAGDSAKTNFPDAACDALFMRNVYHHFADPPVMNASIAAALKPSARLAIVDFTPPPGTEAACPADRGKDGMHGITAATLSRELADAGFQAVSTTAGAQRWFMIVVAKPEPK